MDQKSVNEQTVKIALQESDWVEYPSVADTTKNPHLINLNEWIDYRVALRAIAVNPPDQIIQFPVMPQKIWSN